jgi:hypothetical protein
MNRWSKRAYVLFMALSLLAGGSWAAVGQKLTAHQPDAPAAEPVVASGAAQDLAETLAAPKTSAAPAPPNLKGFTSRLPAGEFLVGTSHDSLAPNPAKVQWDSAKTPCVKEDASLIDPGASDLVGLAQAGHLPPGWPKSPNCIYLGGYGIGPSRPATGVDKTAGVEVRSIAISNGRDIVVWQSLDMVGFFSRYRSDLCPDGCGIRDIRNTIASQTAGKIPVANVAINSTHTHGGADGYGAWGGIPDWYRAQIRDTVLRSAYDALARMAPATLTVGAIDARPFNNERRDTYYSAADYGAVWLQARARPSNAQAPAPVLATLVNFAAHPTVGGSGNTLMYADWTGAASKALGDSLGGQGIVMEGALGNVSPAVPRPAAADLSGDRKVDDIDQAIAMARDFTSYIGADIAHGGYQLTSNRIATKTSAIAHPVTNWVEVAGGLINVLDREFLPHTKGAKAASTYAWRKSENAPAGRGCVAAGPISIKTDVSGFRIGELTVITAPGELFGTMSEVVKSKAKQDSIVTRPDGTIAPGGQAMVFGQTQDSLGYIIQHFETDPGGGLTSNTDPALGEYEEEFMVDRCFGDHVLQVELNLLRDLH